MLHIQRTCISLFLIQHLFLHRCVYARSSLLAQLVSQKYHTQKHSRPQLPGGGGGGAPPAPTPPGGGGAATVRTVQQHSWSQSKETAPTRNRPKLLFLYLFSIHFYLFTRLPCSFIILVHLFLKASGASPPGEGCCVSRLRVFPKRFAQMHAAVALSISSTGRCPLTFSSEPAALLLLCRHSSGGNFLRPTVSFGLVVTDQTTSVSMILTLVLKL